MITFKFPWTKRREARQAAEQKARDDAAWRTIIDAGKRVEEQAKEQRSQARAAQPQRHSEVVGHRFDGATGQSSTIYRSADDPAGTWSEPRTPSHVAAGGGTFDGGGASGDWSGSSCSSSGSDSSSGSSDSGGSCSSD